MKPGKLFVITAPSGAGKTTLVQGVLDKINNRAILDRVITYTTRDARAHEINGVDYHFVSVADFLALREKNFFLEVSQVYGAYYGSPRSLLDDIRCGFSYIMVLDAAGVAQLQLQNVTACYIAITVKSIEELSQRLALRNTENDENREFRLHLAEQEQEKLKNLKISHIIVNEDLRSSIDRLYRIIELELSLGSQPFF